MLYAGANLGKGFSYLTVVDEMGKLVRKGRAESTHEGLLAALSGLRPELRVAGPATRAWQWAPGVLADQDLEVSLAHPIMSWPMAPARGSDGPDAHVPIQRDPGRARAYVPGPETGALRG